MAGAEKRGQSAVEAAVVRRLRGERGAQRVTVTALAQTVGLSREQLSRILNGSKPATFSEMVDIAAALGVDLAAVVAAAQREAVAPAAQPDDALVAADVADLELRLRLEAEAAGANHAEVTGE